MPKKPPPTETFATLSANSSCNEPDMSPVTTDDGEDIRLIETIPDPSPNPAQILLHNEHTAEVDHIQNAFEATSPRPEAQAHPARYPQPPKAPNAKMGAVCQSPKLCRNPKSAQKVIRIFH
jgi:hypothetical protein